MPDIDQGRAAGVRHARLQDQLAAKDLPFLEEVLPGLEWAVLKGRSNYACLQRVREVDAPDADRQGQLELDVAPRARDEITRLRPWLAQTTTGGLRNNFTGFLGMHFTVGPEPLLVSSLGRIMVAGNTGSHLLKLIRVSDATDVPGGSVTVSMTGGIPGQYIYQPLPSPVILAANTRYYLVSQESEGGDQWHQLDTIVIPSAAATVDGPVFGDGLGSWTKSASPNRAFVTVNLRHLTEAPPPEVTVSITHRRTNESMSMRRSKRAARPGLGSAKAACTASMSARLAGTSLFVFC